MPSGLQPTATSRLRNGNVQRAHRMELRRGTAPTCRRRSCTATCCTSASDNGVLSACSTSRPGSATIQARLADGRTGFSASPVASNGRIYFTSEEGDVYVVKAGTTFEQLAVNPLGEVAMATPAISDGVDVLPDAQSLGRRAKSLGGRLWLVPRVWPERALRVCAGPLCRHRRRVLPALMVARYCSRYVRQLRQRDRWSSKVASTSAGSSPAT